MQYLVLFRNTGLNERSKRLRNYQPQRLRFFAMGWSKKPYQCDLVEFYAAFGRSFLIRKQACTTEVHTITRMSHVAEKSRGGIYKAFCDDKEKRTL